ncbi:GNAT family N-acetyltransferase [Pseudalkalibacillus berkeleyi]|uniref:GNAT family N-acetyltransferase n=1 Tax=Pseudalkalibacillus berkeleyi TaxID=1069813 RepID=A0ABS9H326_9BACL|nr:GNAT family N-acetyltransferase [Pseudalkalibacillus berkeleyi]MCF6138258.1 GNAT family N-acetyltransferase [Pseudalkalibacillus berkeleyi]
MSQAVDQIKIVEYDPSYAAAVAKMWNKSRDGWGGSNTVQTEEQVLKQEANTTNLHTYLALEGDEVVGYCGLSEYREDEGALYIPLLNVRDDYHGKKIGKKLVLKALERVIELKWPRLDLYTWPGNTKAVPLYKKCGFFWEERDDATHLMNFMPTVLHTEAVQEFFKDLNWYEASTRPIEVKPDGEKHNDFHYYEYSWTNRGQMLKMQFERFGRGLRSIETDDYEISATIEDFKLVFDSQYKIRYHIKNKTGKPLTVSLKGMDHKNIQFDLSKDFMEVKNEEVIEAPFHVGPIEEEQSVWRTHPSVNTTFLINGKEALFKVGLLPKFPANVSSHTPENLTYKGSNGTFYLDLENNYKEAVTFTFTLPESDLFTGDQQELDIKLQPKSRCSIPVAYTLKEHGFYSPELTITATKEDGTQTTFSKKISVPFKGIGTMFSGESEEGYYVYNGQYQLQLRKFNNWIEPGKEQIDQQESAFKYPKLGKPFSEEFARLRAENVEFIEENNTIGFRATYHSKSFPGVKLHGITKLFAEGLVEQYYEVENSGSVDLEEDLWLNIPVFQTLERAVIPYENRIVEMKDTIGSYHEYWNGKSITENWMFSRVNGDPRGLCWSKDMQINFDSWFVFFENKIGRLKTNEWVRTKPIYMSIGAFQDWKTFRGFARQQASESIPITDHLELVINNHNPFVSEQLIDVQVSDYKASYFNGSIDILSGDKLLKREQFETKDEVKKKNFEVNAENLKKLGFIQSKFQIDSIETTREALYVKKESDTVRYETKTIEGKEAYVCSDGELEIAVAPEFYPGLFSLKSSSGEWLDSSFPKVQPKSWWNPWAGGVNSSLREVTPNSLLKEKRHAEFASLEDSKGNKWEGVKVVVKLTDHEKYKGFEYHQYFLLLPGTSVVCMTTEIIQDSGVFIDRKNWDMNCYFKPDEDLKSSWAEFQNAPGDWQRLYGGKGEQQMRIARNVIFGSENRQDCLQIITDTNDVQFGSYINKEIMFVEVNTKLISEDGNRTFTKPVFCMVNETAIPDTALNDLKSIRF